jgi:DNA polymerase-3 subunit gamma/tau
LARFILTFAALNLQSFNLQSAIGLLAMSYQVLARKYRPQTFDEVIGQRGVTQTLRNAIAGKRIGQSFIFAGPRGVGKTTVARILARALNCEKGPTPDPCGVCDACVEIAQGRSINVLEIDAATHTQIDKVRETIVEGLGLRPVRDRYKVFIIDEVHRLSQNAFDALLKSVEEPPPHVIFMMATTELEKVPATIQSRSLVFELKAIGFKAVMDCLRAITVKEQIPIDESALTLLARAAEGSLRDGLSALDQVTAFASAGVTAEDVATVLGLVRRDLLLEVVEAVAREDAAEVFNLAGRIVEAGYDLRLVCRELARIVRDLLVIRIDPSRLNDPEIASESERDRLKDLGARYSHEDLMRSFDVLSRAEFEVRGSSQPRYHLEMALVRWIHLRKLVPLADLIASLQKGGPVASAPVARPAPPVERPSAPAASRVEAPPAAENNDAAEAEAAPPAGAGGDLKDALLAEIRRVKKFFYGTVVAQAQKIEVGADRVTFTFAPAHRALRAQLDQSRGWLEPLAAQVAKRKMAIVSTEGNGPPMNSGGGQPAANGPASQPTRAAGGGAPAADDLRKKALADPGVQAVLDVFAAEITKIEEI